METDVDVTHDEPTDTDTVNTMRDETVTDSELAETLSEWDSDLSFEFDQDNWPICTPKFVKMHYNGEDFPYEIVSEGP